MSGMPLKIMTLIRQAQGLDPVQESALNKLTPHVPGIVTFADHSKALPWTTDYKTVLMFADISGFTALCERYSSLENAGIDGLTKTLNDYVGALVSIITDAEGDVLKFAGDAVLSLWRVNALRDMLATIEKVITCSLKIQQQCGEWKTSVGITLTVKIGIACGNMSVIFLGNNQFRMYVEMGQAVTEVNKAEKFCKSGYIVLSPYTWEICRKTFYQFELLEDGEHVRILSIKDPVGLRKTVSTLSDVTTEDKEDLEEQFNTSFKFRKMSLSSSATVKIFSNRAVKSSKWRRSKTSQDSVIEDSESPASPTSPSPAISTVPEVKEDSQKEDVKQMENDDQKDNENQTENENQKENEKINEKDKENKKEEESKKDNENTEEVSKNADTENKQEDDNRKVSSPPETNSISASSASTPANPSPFSTAQKGFGKAGISKLRNVVKQVTEMKLDEVLRLFVLPPVLKKLDDNQPLEYLSEMRQVTIVFMNMTLDESLDPGKLLQEMFEVVYNQTKIMHGSLNKVFLFDKGCTFLVIFGLPGYKHERDCAHALMISHKMKKLLNNMAGILQISIGVTTGTTFCGVVGHKNRHEYSVIGRKVNMAARLMMHYPDKVTCDDETYLLSRLPALNFNVLITKRMKGLRNVGIIREYQEVDNTSSILQRVIHFEFPLLGRIEENRLFKKEIELLRDSLINVKYTKCRHFVFSGAVGIGKTRLLDHLICTAERMGLRVVSCSMKLHDSFDQYFLVNNLINMMLTTVGLSHFPEKEPVIMDALIKAGYKSCLYKLNSIMSTSFEKEKHPLEPKDVTAEDILCCIAKTCAEQRGGIMIGIDDAQFIDSSSWKFLNKLSQVPYVMLVCTVLPSALDDPSSPDTTEFIERRNVTLRDLGELEGKHLSALACQLMDVVRVPKELEKMLQELTQGVPSWCEQLLIELKNENQLTILLDKGQSKSWSSLVAPKPELIRRLGTDDDHGSMECRQCNSAFLDHTVIEESDTSSAHNFLKDLGFVHKDSNLHRTKSMTERVAVFAPGINPSDIPVPKSMKELIIARLDSMRAAEQLIVKCAAVLGLSFGRDMIESILPMQRVKARKSFKILAQNGIFECANIPTTQHNIMMNRKDDTTSWDACYCPKDETDYNQDLCDKMRFRNALIQQTAYEVLMENQRLELHAKSAQYLERKADDYRNKIPYYVLGRPPREKDSEKLAVKFQIKVKRRDRRRSTNKVEDQSLTYWKTRGRRHGFSLSDDYKDPLLHVLRERLVSTQLSMDQLLECLLPMYQMILHHWKAAKRKVNIVSQLLEAISVAIAVTKPDKALEMLSDVEQEMSNVEPGDDLNKETITVLHARIKRLTYKTYRMIGQDFIGYKNLMEAAHLLHLKQPQARMSLSFWLSYYKFFLNTNVNRQKPSSQMSIEKCYCLADLYHFHKNAENQELAELTALQFLRKVTTRISITNQLVEGYCAMIDNCHVRGDRAMEIMLGQELFTRCAVQHSELTTDNYKSLARVYTNMCVVSLQLGDIPVTIMAGEGAIDLGDKINVGTYLEEVTPSLAMAFLLSDRFTECRDFLENLRKRSLSKTALSWYHSICLELLLFGETAPDGFDNCLMFATSYLKCLDAVYGQFSSRYFLAMSVALMHCRRHCWIQAQCWYDYWEYYQVPEQSFLALYARTKKVEVMLMSLSVSRVVKPRKVWKQLDNDIKLELKELKCCLELMPSLKPRFYHLKAYRNILRGKIAASKKRLNFAYRIASEQNNMLESRWTQHHWKAWFRGTAEDRKWISYPELKTMDWLTNREIQKSMYTWPVLFDER